jgi:nitroreductase
MVNDVRKVGINGLTGRVCCIAALALLGISSAWGADEPMKPPTAPKTTEIKAQAFAPSGMDTLTAIFTRHSVRKYTDQPISDETVNILLRAAMRAPSARNEQSWEFIVIRDKNILKQFPTFSPFAAHVPGAQVAIVVVGNKKLEAVPGLWIPDCSNAAMSILLAAHSMGLGAVWTTLYPYEERMAGARKLLNLPDNIVPLTVIPLGYPASGEQGHAEDRFKPAKIHGERW